MNAGVPTEKPIGAVLVVGGGIAGMQASLDLAEQGFRVYLVEAQSALGGHMAQLDKTFPTNDCAMCTISPRLVETGRHLNIEVLTQTEVVDVAGEAGHFSVTVRRQPRYIDPLKCVGCGDCTTVCPVTLPNEFEEGLNLRHAVYRLYPQAIPGAYAITKRGVAPCKNACPAETSAQGYVALIAQRRYAEALEVIKQYNPFPASVGRVCHHPCEANCTRGRVEAPVAICHLKRFVADHQAGEPVTPKPRTYDERIAVVGAGPAGLSAAHQLVRLGYGVTVFEALPVPGGMMRVGIPAYRLPRDVLEREIDDILAEGVELRLNSPVHDIKALFAEGYAAIFLAVGAHQPQELGVPGERGTTGVHYGVAFLRAVNLGEKIDLGRRVIVVGGGNTAIDAARTAIRLGARDVTLLYRRTRSEMPAHAREVEAGEAEGLKVELLTAPIEVLSKTGRLIGVRCVRMQLGEPDASGRPRPIPIAGSEFILEADTLIPAVAQAPEISLLTPDHGLNITRWGTFAVDENTLATNRPNIFAGGDAARGPATLIEAIAHGRRAALSIHRTLRDLPLRTPREMEPLPVVHIPDEELADRRSRGTIRPIPRAVMPVVAALDRTSDFREVELGLTEEQALAEARRCIECGICAECYQCVNVCKADAIDHAMAARTETIEAGAVILAPGYQIYNAQLSEEFGCGRYPNVVTALQFERLLSASGPTGGHVQRPSDGATPKKIAFLQCIGSRDQTHDYCSAVCCMYATKEAIMAKEHEPDTEVHIFMMDVRAFSKGYWAYFERARDRYGIHTTRCRISDVREDPHTRDLILRYFDEDGQLRQETFDLVTLSVGMEIAPSVRDLGRRLGIELDEYGFCHTVQFNPLETSRPGIYAVGPFREPKDIPESVIDASGAAASAAARLAVARGRLAREREYPPERDVSDEAPRVGVFVCHCGSNIGGFLDVPGVVEYAKTLPGVVHAEDKLYTCSQDSIQSIAGRVKELGLNRVVVAACTPLTHQPLFQDCIRGAGLNPYLFEMANIRNQCSWVHSHDWEVATGKAKDLVRMATARAALLEPQHMLDVPVTTAALIVGGGAAGMTAALSLAEQGFPVHLVEREAELGGNLRHVFVSRLRAGGMEGGARDPQHVLKHLVERVRANPRIAVHLESKVIASSGFMGNFTSTIQDATAQKQEVSHGVTILATGAQEYRGPDYGYGTDPRIITQQQFEAMLAGPTSSIQLPTSIAMIQCVGPAEKYCSRICCTVALKNAIAFKEQQPGAQVVILYKDIRTYGFKERLYTEAREKGVIFLRYDDEHRPEVDTVSPVAASPGRERAKRGCAAAPDESGLAPFTGRSIVDRRFIAGRTLIIRAWDPILQRSITLEPDLLVLSMPVVPRDDAHDLAKVFKVSIDADGFFLEAHVKLRPVDFASDGVFMAGMAHYPKLLDETMIQAQAAAARAARVLSRDALTAGGRVAVVDESKCTGCLTCVRICPFGVPKIKANLTGVGSILGAAYIEAAVCQGCGSCVAECPARAIQLMHYTDAQMAAKVRALLEPPAGFVPVKAIAR